MFVYKIDLCWWANLCARGSKEATENHLNKSIVWIVITVNSIVIITIEISVAVDKRKGKRAVLY